MSLALMEICLLAVVVPTAVLPKANDRVLQLSWQTSRYTKKKVKYTG